VFFVFIFETVQTALTGADVYYWFIAGFDVFENPRDFEFSLIDIAMMGGIISLVVQSFFCYRIYTLNKRLWWLCTVIAVVSLIPPTFRKYLFIVLIQKLSVAQASGSFWYGIKVSITQLLLMI
jgi:hypothetical protein